MIEDFWGRDEFPHDIVPKMAALDIGGVGYQGYGAAGGSWLLNGFICMELARGDSSIATFYGVHTGLSAGSIYLCGDDEEKQRWLPAMMRFEKIGSFGPTEAVVVVGELGGSETHCRRAGGAQGAYEHALRYAQTRIQFGRAIGGFQLVQDLLVRMLSNVTACQSLMLRLGQLQDQGLMHDEHASLAKAFCTVKCRETVGWARELLGGNGILLENHVGRYVADAEAIYSYEGTREMNTLIVGKSITGLSAFI